MEKYLFNDGTNPVREVQSKEELEALAEALDPQKALVWIFHSSEWITYAQFRSRFQQTTSGKKIQDSGSSKRLAEPGGEPHPRTRASRPSTWKWWLGALSVIVLTLLVYNFTRVQWKALPTLQLRPERPENAPPLDADSLQAELEARRGTKLDVVTRTNLRIRNGWPDRILLQLDVLRDSSSAGIRYQPQTAVLDNATGYLIDEAVAEWNVWRDGRSVHSEKIDFSKINYTAPGKKELSGTYVGDSISVHFLSLKAKSFNFCYSYDKQSNYGNLSDRWFCR